jgi:hypothetical protein
VWFIRFCIPPKNLGVPGSSRGTLEHNRADLTELTKILCIFNQKLKKNCWALGNKTRHVYPGSPIPDPYYIPFQIPGSKKHWIPDPGSATLYMCSRYKRYNETWQRLKLYV